MWGTMDVPVLGIIPMAGVDAETGADVAVPLIGSPPEPDGKTYRDVPSTGRR